ncbi:23894_t:CDS:2, partial [Racocetra persica]
TCTCSVALGGAPCKHQAAVTIYAQNINFNIIAGTIVEDTPFFASLRASNNEWVSEIVSGRSNQNDEMT